MRRDLSARAVGQLQALQTWRDTEMAHRTADEVLLELLRKLGYEDVVVQWHKVPKWYA